ncbi:hypothetical protein G5O_0610 [Chlamydia psittaci 6BC]|nr:hypothetical protein G5O_0610 [Chlamydia psittaci 6BC]
MDAIPIIVIYSFAGGIKELIACPLANTVVLM